MTAFTTETRQTEVTAYLDEVAARLTGLAEPERAEILDDLAQHLAEVAAEAGPPLRERLGSPADYAAELLASAGMTAARPPTSGRARLADLLGRPGLERLSGTAIGRELWSLRPVLRPAWQVARAYLAVSLLAAVTLGGHFPGLPVPRLFASPLLGLVAVIAGIALSVRLDRAELTRGGRWLVTLANVVLMLYALVLLGNSERSRVSYVQAGAPKAMLSGCLSDGSGSSITNLYAYDIDGRLLDPVLLYDQAGHPVDNLCPQVDSQGRRLRTQYRRDVNGAPVINAFPRSQSVEADGGRPGSAFPPATYPADGDDPATAGQPGTATVPPPPAVVVPRLPAPTTTALPATTTTVAPPP